MADEYSDYAPQPLHSIPGSAPTREHGADSRGQRQPQRPRPPRKEEAEDEDEAAEHFNELAAAAEAAHRRLVEMDSPYRFCIYRREGEIYIDLILIDEEGEMVREVNKAITHEQFRRWLDAIEQGEGLFFEGTA